MSRYNKIYFLTLDELFTVYDDLFQCFERFRSSLLFIYSDTIIYLQGLNAVVASLQKMLLNTIVIPLN